MEIKINLGLSSFAEHGEVVTLPEESVILSFLSPLYTLPELIVTVYTETEGKQYKLNNKNNSIDISEFCKKAGRIDISATLIAKGKPVKKWTVEPIRLIEIDGAIVPVPELIALRDEVYKLKTALAELYNTYNI